jgi:hypothetical protein
MHVVSARGTSQRAELDTVLAVVGLHGVVVATMSAKMRACRCTAEALYLGWFGPVGVSALFYLTFEAHRLGADETVLALGDRP